MSNDTPTREQVGALLADLPPGPFTTDERFPGRVYCDDDFGTVVADCGPFELVARRYSHETLAAFFAAAPLLARAYLATLDRAEAAERRVVELEAVLAAERGEPAGAPSEGWTPEPCGWCHYGSGGHPVAECERPEGVTGPVHWYVWPEDINDPPTFGRAATFYDAMKAADAALRAVTKREGAG